MSLSLTSQQLQNDEGDIITDSLEYDYADDNTYCDHELTHDSEKQNRAKSDLNYSLENQLQNKQAEKEQNTTIIPQDLQKSDELIKLDECNIGKSVLGNAQRWHCDSSIDEDPNPITAAAQSISSSSLQITSIDGFFNRKRGRPPKNRFVEVYKNTHRKPQAIFTSFKLEKQQGVRDAATNYENATNYCLQSNVETLRDCENNNKFSIAYSRHKPANENSTHRKRFGSNVNFSTNMSDERVKPAQNEAHGNLGNEHIEMSKSLSTDSWPKLKKAKLCATAGNVTVIRAAGTFYPENSNGSSNVCKHFKEGLADLNKEKQSSLSYGNEVAENLSLKDTVQIKAAKCLEPSTSASSMTAGLSSVLPKIYNILQMQQQLFAFYQQLALMAPAFPHLDLKRFLAPTFEHNAVANSTIPSSSVTAPTDSVMELIHNNHLLSMILNLQWQQAHQKSDGELALENNMTATATTAAATKTTKDSNRSQSTTTSFDISSRAHYMTEPKIQERQVQCGSSGYLQFLFNEDCSYEKCSYRKHQSHFHCNRADCQYGICNKTRLRQHTARHERLDSLMGNDFQQYRATMTCNYANCPYAFNEADDLNDKLNPRKAYHFHCLKCPFVCADTSKILAHRRLHSKMEFVRLAGFRKVATNENCMMPNVVPDSKKYPQYTNVYFTCVDQKPLEQFDATYNQPTFETVSHCPYAMRYAHYHCLVCNYSVLSRSQLLAHKHRNSPASNRSSMLQQPPESAQLSRENQVCLFEKEFENI